MPSLVVAHPLPSQVRLVLQPAAPALVGIVRLPARVVVVVAARPPLRPTVVVRGPIVRCCFLDQPIGRPTLQLKMRGLL